MRYMLYRGFVLWWLLHSSAHAMFTVDGQPLEEGYVQESHLPTSTKGKVTVINTQPDTADEPPPQPFRRPYFRFRFSNNELEFNHIHNKTYGIYSAPTNRGTRSKRHQFSGAWGYLKDNIGTEVEVYVPRSFHYVGNPVLQSGANFNYTAKVQPVGFFGNANYLLWDFHNVQPYLSVGLGLVMKQVHVVASSGATGQKRYPCFQSGWNLGGGAAFQISKNMGLDFSYRIVDLGRTKLTSVENTYYVKLAAHTAQVQGYAFGFFYRF